MERSIEQLIEEKQIAKTQIQKDFRDAVSYGYYRAYSDFCNEFGFEVDKSLLEKVKVSD